MLYDPVIKNCTCQIKEQLLTATVCATMVPIYLGLCLNQFCTRTKILLNIVSLLVHVKAIV